MFPLVLPQIKVLVHCSNQVKKKKNHQVYSIFLKIQVIVFLQVNLKDKKPICFNEIIIHLTLVAYLPQKIADYLEIQTAMKEKMKHQSHQVFSHQKQQINDINDINNNR